VVEGADPVVALARRALAMVARARPDAWAAMAASLDGLCLAVEVDGALRLRGEGGALTEGGDDGPAAIRVRCDREAVRDLVAGRATLLGAVRAGRVEVAGEVAALRRGLRAFEAFVGALLRIDEAESLRREL